jgi:hypothetical protein
MQKKLTNCLSDVPQFTCFLEITFYLRIFPQDVFLFLIPT